eukprot:6695289-Prymnesium_polylepis.1
MERKSTTGLDDVKPADGCAEDAFLTLAKRCCFAADARRLQSDELGENSLDQSLEHDRCCHRIEHPHSLLIGSTDSMPVELGAAFTKCLEKVRRPVTTFGGVGRCWEALVRY